MRLRQVAHSTVANTTPGREPNTAGGLEVLLSVESVLSQDNHVLRNLSMIEELTALDAVYLWSFTHPVILEIELPRGGVRVL